MDSGLRWGNATTLQIRKRSLRRAHRRLQVHGHTWYRGQFWQQEVPQPQPPTFVVENPQLFSSQPPEHLPQNRLVIWHWSAGMLTTSRYQELLHYLHLQKVDVALISETHRSYTNEWSTMHLHVIHTGCDSSNCFEKASGLLLLISKKLCQAHQIAWNAIAPGRLIHCRLHLSSKPVDVLGVYINIHGTLLLHRRYAGRRSGNTSAVLYRHCHNAIPCVLLVTSIAHCLTLQGWWELRHVKMIKLQKIQRLTDEAQQAHEQHDSFRLYNVISRHCPKVRNKRIDEMMVNF